MTAPYDRSSRSGEIPPDPEPSGSDNGSIIDHSEDSPDNRLNLQIQFLKRDIDDLNQQIILKDVAISQMRSTTGYQVNELLNELYPSGTRGRVVLTHIAYWIRRILSIESERESRIICKIDNFPPVLRPDKHTAGLLKSRLKQKKPEVKFILIIENSSSLYNKIIRSTESVLRQAYKNWELFIFGDVSPEYYNTGDPRIHFLSPTSVSIEGDRLSSRIKGDFIGYLMPGDELVPGALAETALWLEEYPGSDIVYSDELVLDEDGSPRCVYYRPDYSEELLLSTGYISQFTVFRASLFEDGIPRHYDPINDLSIFSKSEKVAHIPKILYATRDPPGRNDAERARAVKDFIRAKGIEAEVIAGQGNGVIRVKRRIRGEPMISIVIPTRDRVSLLKRCIESIENNSTYQNLEFIIIDNLSQETETLDYFAVLKRESPRYKIIRYPYQFNYSSINNFGVTHASGEHFLFMNNDLEVIAPGWIEALLEHSQRGDIGCVGARLLYPDGSVQHAGVIVGLYGGADQYGKLAPRTSHGYLDAYISTRECSAVTSACMMIKKDLFFSLGGFDELFIVGFGDTDLCLKAIEKGYRNIYTPYAELFHHESATRGKSDNADPHPIDTFLLKHKWGDYIRKGDPFYNPNLPLDTLDIAPYVKCRHDRD